MTRKSEHGYSLLELLAAFSLVLILAGLVFNGIKFGNRVWAKSDEQFTAAQTQFLITGLIKDWVEQAVPMQASSRDHLTFSGTKSEMTFTGPLNPGALDDALYDITLEFSALDKTLTARWSEVDSRRTGERVLFENLEGFSFSYFATPEGQSPASWKDRWENKPTMPALIKVSYQFEEGAGVSMITTPKIDWGADCVFDISTQTCRGRK